MEATTGRLNDIFKPHGDKMKIDFTKGKKCRVTIPSQYE